MRLRCALGSVLLAVFGVSGIRPQETGAELPGGFNGPKLPEVAHPGEGEATWPDLLAILGHVERLVWG